MPPEKYFPFWSMAKSEMCLNSNISAPILICRDAYSAMNCNGG